MSNRLDRARVGKSNDKRIKLTDTQRGEIMSMKGLHSQRHLAEIYGVSRRLISFILYPEKLIENKKRREERGGTKQYYDKELHRVYAKNHRKYKQKLLNEGVIT